MNSCTSWSHFGGSKLYKVSCSHSWPTPRMAWWKKVLFLSIKAAPLFCKKGSTRHNWATRLIAERKNKMISTMYANARCYFAGDTVSSTNRLKEPETFFNSFAVYRGTWLQCFRIVLRRLWIPCTHSYRPRWKSKVGRLRDRCIYPHRESNISQPLSLPSVCNCYNDV